MIQSLTNAQPDENKASQNFKNSEDNQFESSKLALVLKKLQSKN